MHNKPVFLAAILFLFLVSTSYAETTFIKDQLNVPVYADKPSAGMLPGDALATLDSGSAVDVLLNDGDYSKIRYKETEGWIESNMLTKEKPQKIRYLQLLAKFKKTSEELEQAQSQLGTMQDTKKEAQALGRLTKELEQAKSKISTLEQQLKTQDETKTAMDSGKEPENEPQPKTHSKNSSVLSPIPAAWAGGGMVLCLILGIYLGYTYLDRAISKRHGGVRLR